MISTYSAEECERIAKSAALRYVNTNSIGITRKRAGRGFAFYSPKGLLIKDKAELKRIKSLAIPPAYQEVWICPFANGHIQAIGTDERGRKQYRYHPLWQDARNANKFQSMIAFGKALPAIRNHIDDELKKPVSLDKKQVICAVLYLLNQYNIRIGNAIYAKQNKSYGLTTLRKKHLTLGHNTAQLDFVGKNAKPWHVVLKDKKIINILKKCEEIPGYELFKYQDEQGNTTTINSQDINHYLQQLTSQPFTAKDFRTWAACREALSQFLAHTDKDKSLKSIICEVASLLGHTPAICQKNYIHGELIDWFKEKKYQQWVSRRKKYLAPLDDDERLLYWLSKNTVIAAKK